MGNVYAIILAGGSGIRFGSKIPKQFIEVNGKCILEYTVEKFNNNKNIDNIILVVNPAYRNELQRNGLLHKYEKIIAVVDGGKTRRESSYLGLQFIDNSCGKVLIHDAVRPFVSHDTIDRCVYALEKYEVVYPAVSSADTLIQVNDDFLIQEIPRRKYMMRGQTPQGFKIEIIKKAHYLAKNDETVDQEVTNDCGLVYRYNLADIKVIQGNRENVKITYPQDFVLMKKLMQNSAEGADLKR